VEDEGSNMPMSKKLVGAVLLVMVMVMVEVVVANNGQGTGAR